MPTTQVKSGFVNIDKAQIYYEITGQATPHNSSIHIYWLTCTSRRNRRGASAPGSGICARTAQILRCSTQAD